jgi:hypothetical protein
MTRCELPLAKISSVLPTSCEGFFMTGVIVTGHRLESATQSHKLSIAAMQCILYKKKFENNETLASGATWGWAV